MVAALQRLGARPSKTALVRIGALEELCFADKPPSVNLEASSSELSVISTRALEPLYNVDILLRAFARVHAHLQNATLRLIGDGSQRMELAKLAVDLGLSDAVRFFGRVSPERVRDELSGAHVYVSVPSSDSMAASTMEAMARGAFPIVSDLPSVAGFIEHGVNGLLVTPSDVETLANALQRALVDADLRRRAVELNRAGVEMEGRLVTQVEKLEAAFYRLAGIT
jgi:glycosyltransferase involved in cell wall biosynthesis